MKNILVATKQSTLLAAVALTILGVGGCADRNNNGQPDTISQPAVNKAIAKVESTTKSAVKKIEPAVKQMEKKAEPVVKNLANATVTTSRVKAALLLNPSLREMAINVDTKNQSVILRGAVKNTQQKAVAARIAAETAPGYKIVNQLEVSGQKPAKTSANSGTVSHAAHPNH